MLAEDARPVSSEVIRSNSIIDTLEEGDESSLPCFFDEFTITMKLFDGLEDRTFKIYPMVFNGRLLGMDLYKTRMVLIKKKPSGKLEIDLRRNMRKNCIILTAKALLTNH